MPNSRRYEDPCGVARALDVIGDRWALLVVRELIFGSKRFVQLRNGLHGISPNVLSERLHQLEETAVVRHELLDPPASVAVYELTDRGRALEPILLELGRWGSQEPVNASPELSVSALLLALKTVFDPAVFDPAVFDPARSVDATFVLQVGGEWFRLSVAEGVIDITQGRGAPSAVTLRADVPTLRSVAFGREPIAEAERDGRLTIEGDRDLAGRFAAMFPVSGRSLLVGRQA